jgi:hypothetical protein
VACADIGAFVAAVFISTEKAAAVSVTNVTWFRTRWRLRRRMSGILVVEQRSARISVEMAVDSVGSHSIQTCCFLPPIWLQISPMPWRIKRHDHDIRPVEESVALSVELHLLVQCQYLRRN